MPHPTLPAAMQKLLNKESKYSFSSYQFEAAPTSMCGTVTLTLLPCSMSITAGCAVSIDAGLKSTTNNIVNDAVITAYTVLHAPAQ